MSPRRILHEQNRVMCSPESNFYADVQKLIEGLRKIIKSHLGDAHFVTLKKTADNKTANMEALNFCLSTLRHHVMLQTEVDCKKIDCEFLIHMALSELDKSHDHSRDH